MKTPETIANEFMEVDDEWRPSESQWVTLKAIISKIQQDAFESGRLSGLNEAGELCQSHEQTKTEYMIRLHNLIYQNSQIVVTPTGSGYNFGAKITVEHK